mgnify:CR=1 FL=1
MERIYKFSHILVCVFMLQNIFFILVLTCKNTSVHIIFCSFIDACCNTVNENSTLLDGFDVDVQTLGKDWIPEFSDSSKPFLDQRFSDLDQGFIFYKEYGRQSGFDVRRSTKKSDRFGNTITKYFVCSRSSLSLIHI